MLKITQLLNTSHDVFHVIHEPGNATRYDYVVLQLGDTFAFAPANNFEYPIKLNYHDVKNITDIDNAKMHILGRTDISNNVNPHTLLQCINVIRKIIHHKV